MSPNFFVNLANDVFRGLYGAGVIAAFRKDGVATFDISDHGFWRSFIAYPICAVLQFFTLMQPSIVAPEERSALQMGVDTSAKLLTMIAALVAMFLLSKLIKRYHRFTTFVIIFNWANVVIAAITLVMAIIAALLIGQSFERLPLLFSFIYILVYTWFVLHESLDIDIILATLLLIIVIVAQELANSGLSAAVRVFYS